MYYLIDSTDIQGSTFILNGVSNARDIIYWGLNAELNESSQVFTTPGRNIVASITKKQLEEIAKQKMADLNAHDIEEASKIIAGSARSMGIEVKE